MLVYKNTALKNFYPDTITNVQKSCKYIHRTFFMNYLSRQLNIPSLMYDYFHFYFIPQHNHLKIKKLT